MSSNRFRKPGFRLLFGYPDIVFVRDGSDQPLLTAAADSPGLVAGLRRCGALVAAEGGRLTVVLPADEVWRGLPVLLGRTPIGRRRSAFRRAAVELGVRPEALAVTLGGRLREGATPVAAVRASTLAEARALLDRAGLRPDAVVGAGLFPGFAAPPALTLPWQMPSLAFVSRGRWPVAVGASALAAIAVALVLPSTQNGDRAGPAAVPAAPVVAPLADPLRQASAADAAPPSAPAPVEMTAGVLRSPSPLARAATDAAVAPRPQPKVTVASRNVGFPLPGARPAAAGVRVAELTSARARPSDLVTPPPLRRPAATTLSDADLAPIPALRPERRPAAKRATATAAAAVTTAARPRPRRGTDVAPLVVAALTPAAAVAALPASPRIDTPPSRAAAAPARAPGKPPAMAAKPASPAPKVARGSSPAPGVRTLAAAPALRVAAVPQGQEAAPRTEVIRVAAPAPQKPVMVRAPAPAPQKPVMVRAPAPAKSLAVRQPAPPKVAVRQQMAGSGPEPASSGRRANLREVALIGVFSGENGRHALVQMPNGKVERVRAGDSVQGLQVASIGSDSVSLRAGGRESTLRLPE